MSDSKNNGLFWAALLIISGGAIWAINKYLVNIDNSANNDLPNDTPNPTPNPTFDKYAYGSSQLTGIATQKNSNTDLDVTITDIVSKVNGKIPNQHNSYLYNLTIVNKLTTSITIRSILLLFFVNNKYVGFAYPSTNSLIKGKGKLLLNNIPIVQESFTYTLDNVFDENAYFEGNIQNLPLRDTVQQTGWYWDYHGETADVYDPITKQNIINPNATQVFEYQNAYVLDFDTSSFLEDMYMNNYTITVKGFISYIKNTKDNLDGGNVAYLGLISNHKAESTKPFTSSYAPIIGSGSGGSGSSTTSKSKYGIGNYIPPKTITKHTINLD